MFLSVNFGFLRLFSVKIFRILSVTTSSDCPNVVSLCIMTASSPVFVTITGIVSSAKLNKAWSALSTDLFVYFEQIMRWSTLLVDASILACGLVWSLNDLLGSEHCQWRQLWRPNHFELCKFCGTKGQKCRFHSEYLFRRQWIPLLIFQNFKTYQAVGFQLKQNMKNTFEFSSAWTYGEAYDASRGKRQSICGFRLS